MRLRDYYLVFRRRWWLIIFLIVLGTAAAFGFSKWQEKVAPVYRSDIVLRVDPSRPDYGLNLATQSLLRNLTLVVNEAMYQRINDSLKLDMSNDTMASKIRMQTDPDYLAIRVEIDDSDPNRAQAIAQALGKDFEEQQQIRNANLDPNNRINVSVVNPARVGTQIWPKPYQNAATGALLGLLLGIVLAFVLEFLDDTLKTAEDVERFTSLPIMGQIPVTGESRNQRKFNLRLAGIPGTRLFGLVLAIIGALVLGYILGGRIA